MKIRNKVVAGIAGFGLAVSGFVATAGPAQANIAEQNRKFDTRLAQLGYSGLGSQIGKRSGGIRFCTVYKDALRYGQSRSQAWATALPTASKAAGGNKTYGDRIARAGHYAYCPTA